MKVYNSQKAPEAIGPYVQAIAANGNLYLSGVLGIDRSTGKMAGESTEEQAKQIFKNIEYVLAEAGLTLNHVIKTTIFLTTMDDFQTVNQVYGANFSSHKPARSCIAVSALPLNAKVEIELIAELV
ncbi:Rid family detoxifying hydrolase [Culicoidibacter larvae]|uniref:RidA family protein n=1 Tax=Culicoidibacter larvae TaxID=2579976 RepID=A0A5R8QA01_9FIRM|nr:Rid family detoxifying hydrolase [Culicoidibacter larvae]TLG72746.1 RidA family protein [Culicoidibacter larvae]